MQFRKSCFFMVLIFIAAMGYLQQKVRFYVAAYELSRSYQINNELSSRRDFLARNFYQEVTVVKLNQWAQANKFYPADKNRVLALNLKPSEPSNAFRLAGLLRRLPGIATVNAESDMSDVKTR